MNRADPSGKLANWLIGGLVGGIVGGIFAAFNGTDVFAGAMQGAVSGAIAGAAVDAALATVATGGVAGVAIAAGVAFLGGFGGNMAGEQVHSLVAEGHLARVDNKMLKRSFIAGGLNVISLGISTHLKCCDEGLNGFNKVLKPAEVLTDVKKNISNLSIKAIDGPIASAALNIATVGCFLLSA